jgi:hypothetical protein
MRIAGKHLLADVASYGHDGLVRDLGLRELRNGMVPQIIEPELREWTLNALNVGLVRRRTRPMSSFTHPDSCDRIVLGVISHLNRSWELKPLKEFTQDA